MMSENKTRNCNCEDTVSDIGNTVAEPLLADDDAIDKDKTKTIIHSKGQSSVTLTLQDRRWAWVVAFAAFMAHFLIDGCIASFGIFYPVLLREFEAGPATTSAAGSLITGVYMLSSPLVALLIRRYSCRLVGFIGGCLAGAGLIMASISTSIVVFMLGYGIIAGFGVAMNALSSVVMVNEYFHENRGTGQGILFAGAGCGVLVLAPVFQVLLQYYGWHGAFLIVGGLLLNFCVCASLMRPIQHKQKSSNIVTGHSDVHSRFQNDVAHKPQEPINKPTLSFTLDFKSGETSGVYSSDNNLFQNGRTKIYDTQFTSMPNINSKTTKRKDVLNNYSSLLKNSGMLLSNGMLCSGSVYGSKYIVNEKDLYKEVPTDNKEICYESKRSSRFCDPSMLHNPVYIPILIGGVLLQMAQFIPTTYIPDYCETIGLSGQSASIVIAVFGAFNVAGRLTSGFLANLNRISSLWMFNVAMLICGVSCFLFPLCRTFATLCLYASALGFFIGFSPPLQVLILVEYLGLDNFSASMGFLQMCKGPAAIAGPPLAGVVYVWTGDYAISIVFAAVLYVLATGIQSLVPLIDRCKSKDQHDDQPNHTVIVTQAE